MDEEVHRPQIGFSIVICVKYKLRFFGMNRKIRNPQNMKYLFRLLQAISPFQFVQPRFFLDHYYDSRIWVWKLIFVRINHREKKNLKVNI